jgi:hypothetical protein
VRLLLLPKSGDFACQVIAFLILFLFISEFILNTAFRYGQSMGCAIIALAKSDVFTACFRCFTCPRPAFIGSFFFYLDFLAAISVIPDIPLIWNPLLMARGWAVYFVVFCKHLFVKM